jgi:hypothetical protein
MLGSTSTLAEPVVVIEGTVFLSKHSFASAGTAPQAERTRIRTADVRCADMSVLVMPKSGLSGKASHESAFAISSWAL